ncbi:gliding motility-associated C-terminal domain-containing protein [Chitinophagaceae bacterium MMS25-I14]
MNKKILFIVCSLLSVQAFSQGSPGGVKTGLNFWIKADGGISLPATTVSQWNDLSGANVTGNLSVSNALAGNTAPAYTPVGVNFNPHVAFVYTQPNALASANVMVGNNLFDANTNTIIQVIRPHFLPASAAGGGTGVWMKWQNANTGARLGFEINNGGNPGQLRFDFNGTVRETAQNVNEQYVLATFQTSTSARSISLSGASIFTMASAVNSTTCVGRLSIGNEPPISAPPCQTPQSVDPYPTTMDIAEIMIYKGTMSAADRNKAESYLAIKYGFTLDQSASYAYNYTSANGTVVWNRANNLPFINNITGIGRDDSSALDQRQSKSINAAGIITIYNGAFNGNNFPSANTGNTNAYSANNSFILFGDNGLGTTFTRCYQSGSAGFLRMARVWKMQKTGTIGQFTLAVKSSDVPANTKTLLVSSDSAFTTANTTAYPLDFNNNIYSKTITIPGDAYFTFAGDSLKALPTSNSPLCVGSTIQLNANVNVTPFTVNWTGPNGYTSTTTNPSITNATIGNSGVYTLSGTIAGCPMVPGSVTVAVSPIPAPPFVTTPVVYCMNAAAVPLTAIATAGNPLLWYYAPTGGAGSPTPPVPSTLYEDTLTYWVSQTNNGCEGPRSKLEVYIHYKPNGVILATKSTVCQYDTVSFRYFGNARPDAQIDWKSPIPATVALSGAGTPGPFVVRFDSIGTQTIRMQVNNGGCVSDEVLYGVKVKAAPVFRTSLPKGVCVGQPIQIGLNYVTPGVDNYSWDFDGGNILYGTTGGGPYGVSWSTAGEHYVTLVASAAACPSLKHIDTVDVHPLPNAHINGLSSSQICSDDRITLSANDADSGSVYTWSPAQYFGGFANAGPVTTAQITYSGYVSLKIIDKNGCEGEDSTYVTAEPCCTVALPDAFTPNGDGKNDYYHIITKGNHKISTFRIVNRWGQVVFETADETAEWDGSVNGVQQEMGVYYYYLKYRCVNGELLEKRGEFTLIR